MIDFDGLQRWMCQQALALTEVPGIPPGEAYKAMANEPELLKNWWDGAFEQSEQEGVLLEAAARALARGEPLPELSLPQRGRLALRLRLASRILRALHSSGTTRPKGWFRARLDKFSASELLEWLLVDAWPMCAEILDETLTWADEFERPPGYSSKRSPRGPSDNESASLSE